MSKYERGYTWGMSGTDGTRMEVRTGKIELGEVHSLMIRWGNGEWLPLYLVASEYFIRREEEE